jgi:Poly(A) polymerase catalytic subunit
MEAALKDIYSPELKKPRIQDLLKSLEATIEKAKDIRNTKNFANPNLRKGLEIVEKFIKAKKRVCYGGMAINAHLPVDKQFYDFTKNLPDYDFFSPNAEQDIKDLVSALNIEGLPYVEAKFGIHEGTTKIYVDFSAVADITNTSQKFYETLYRRSYLYKGINYADANFLRMSMYLELSRPMGEVERWDKVYSRLLLFNEFVPFLDRGCRLNTISKIDGGLRNIMLDFCTRNSLIYCGADLENFYKNPNKSSDSWLSRSRYPLIAFSSDILHDIHSLKESIEQEDNSKLKIYRWSPEDEFVPFLLGLVKNGKIVALLVEVSACHSYNTITYKKSNVLRIASLDTLITLYYSLSFIKGLDGLARTSFSCLGNHIAALSSKTRDLGKNGGLEPFPLTCMGHQPTKESLMLAKYLRIQEWKKGRNTKKKARQT